MYDVQEDHSFAGCIAGTYLLTAQRYVKAVLGALLYSTACTYTLATQGSPLQQACERASKAYRESR